jgi:3-methyladenine DNA glycosylase AlkD
MNLQDVLAIVVEHQNERGISNWLKMRNTCGLKSYGLGLTALRQLAKRIGRNRQLALECWQSDYYELKVIGLLIDEPKKSH